MVGGRVGERSSLREHSRQTARSPSTVAGRPQAMADTSALVLFSGGQDSTVCLAWALARYDRVETVGFDYGQRHAVELKQRPLVRAELARLFPERATRLGQDHSLQLATL